MTFYNEPVGSTFWTYAVSVSDNLGKFICKVEPQECEKIDKYRVRLDDGRKLTTSYLSFAKTEREAQEGYEQRLKWIEEDIKRRKERIQTIEDYINEYRQ